MSSKPTSTNQWPALTFGPLNLWRVAPAWQLGRGKEAKPTESGYRVAGRAVSSDHYVQARNR